ncbi:MAG: OstA family protein [Deferribacteraceae bacterium]|jgi:lipopolysaccharide export system protein LptA|nr:OstA family protein [Deferribacteraceae bacterium]
MNIRIILALLMIFVGVSFGADKPSVKVESDSLVFSSDSNISVFKGNVVAHYEDIVIKSDNMTVFFKKDKKVDRILSEGNVQVTKGDLYSLSEYAEINVDLDNAVLRKNVKVWQGQNYLEGDEVIIYNKENRVIVNKGDNSRVKIIFFPESEDNGTKN